MLLKLMMTPAGMAFDKFLVRWLGFSWLCILFAKNSGFPPRPALLLVTTGRRSGKERSSVLPYFEVGKTRFIIGSKGGAPTDPLWVENLRAKPAVRIFVGGRSRPVTARIAAGAERETLWQEVVRMVPTYAGYQSLTTREIPVVILES
jgi:deazaflavin-dependent oxidoreductase (nitroreductase family)